MKSQRRKWYQSSIFTIIMLIFFWPVGLFLMWKYQKHWKKFVKIIITAIFVFFVLIFIAAPTDTDQDQNQVQIEKEKADQAKKENAEKAKKENAEKAKKENAEKAKKENADKAKKENAKEQDPEVDANGWTRDNKITFMTITQSISDEFLSKYKAPWGVDDWTFAKFDDEGRIMVTTKYSLRETSEKQPVMCVFTWNPDTEMYRGHFLSVGNKIYLDDGTCDEFFNNLNDIANELNNNN